MALKQEYFDLLDHVGQTSTIQSLYKARPTKHVVGMRHDVDHDLDLALEMAHHESQRGFQSTYYLLHTEKYWNEEDFALKVKQLSEYGHEVGLHVNAFSSWFLNSSNDPKREIEQALAQLRACGVEVTGVCAHGDKLCYQHQFVNYWMWKELRGKNPEITEDGISAEGIHVEDERYQISYPISHSLKRDDGLTISLWDMSMQDQGIKYDAAHLNCDHYWTDSGGGWDRGDNPMEQDFSSGQHQVLVHPWWWRGPTKTIFIMSPARSGSKWLANYIDKATSAVGLHDWTLNHVREGDEYPLDNRTTREFMSLLGDAPEISSRLRSTRAHHALLRKDVVECNVYVEAVAEMLQTNIPDAEIIHLKREPTDVVRSILNRGWYEVTDDQRHRTDDSKEWETSNQLERACRYVLSANNNIAKSTENTILFEEMVSNPDYLPEKLIKLGVVVHPYLASELYLERINTNKNENLPPIDSWPNDVLEKVSAIFSNKKGAHAFLPVQTNAALINDNTRGWPECQISGASIRRQIKSVVVNGKDGVKSSIVFLGTGWNQNSDKGIKIKPGNEYSINISLEKSDITARIFMLGYDDVGEIVSRQHFANIRPTKSIIKFMVKPCPKIKSISVAILVDSQSEDWEFKIKNIRISNRTQSAEYSITSLFK